MCSCVFVWNTRAYSEAGGLFGRPFVYAHCSLGNTKYKELGLPTELFAERLWAHAFDGVRCSYFDFCL